MAKLKAIEELEKEITADEEKLKALTEKRTAIDKQIKTLTARIEKAQETIAAQKFSALDDKLKSAGIDLDRILALDNDRLINLVGGNSSNVSSMPHNLANVNDT